MARIALLEGQWAEMRPHMTLPMRDAFNACVEATRAAAAPEQEATREMEEAERRLVLASIVEWSFGGVVMETLVNEVPLEDQERLGEEAVKVVMKSPLFERAMGSNGGNGASGSSRRSSGGGRSRRSSRSPMSAP